jgi:hypothetical protein
MQLGTEKTKGLDDDTVQLVQGHLIALHWCGSEECHGALGTLVVEEFEARVRMMSAGSSSKLADIIRSMKGNLCCDIENLMIAEMTAHPIPE